VKAPGVDVGDRMRISTELLQRIHASRDHWSEIVTLVAVRVEEDGTKTLLVERLSSDQPVEIADVEIPY
jgi:Trp operon repressor